MLWFNLGYQFATLITVIVNPYRAEHHRVVPCLAAHLGGARGRLGHRPRRLREVGVHRDADHRLRARRRHRDLGGHPVRGWQLRPGLRDDPVADAQELHRHRARVHRVDRLRESALGEALDALDRPRALAPAHRHRHEPVETGVDRSGDRGDRGGAAPRRPVEAGAAARDPGLWLAVSMVLEQLDSQNQHNSVFQRLEWFREVYAYWKHAPIFGHGLRFWYVDPTLPYQPPQAELEVVASTGLFGLAAFVVMWIGFAVVLGKRRQGLRHARPCRRPVPDRPGAVRPVLGGGADLGAVRHRRHLPRRARAPAQNRMPRSTLPLDGRSAGRAGPRSVLPSPAPYDRYRTMVPPADSPANADTRRAHGAARLLSWIAPPLARHRIDDPARRRHRIRLGPAADPGLRSDRERPGAGARRPTTRASSSERRQRRTREGADLPRHGRMEAGRRARDRRTRALREPESVAARVTVENPPSTVDHPLHCQREHRRRRPQTSPRPGSTRSRRRSKRSTAATASTQINIYAAESAAVPQSHPCSPTPARRSSSAASSASAPASRSRSSVPRRIGACRVTDDVEGNCTFRSSARSPHPTALTNAAF